MVSVGYFLRELRAKYSDEPTGFLWVEREKVAASGYPASRGQLEWLAKQGIEVVLTLTEQPLPPEWTEGLPIAFRHTPMKDHMPPEQEDLGIAAAFVRDSVNSGKKVLVHCLAGKGRTMTVLAAYLMMERKMGPEEAIRSLREMRPGAVEKGQEQAVFEFVGTVQGSP